MWMPTAKNLRKETFSQIKHTLRPIVTFLELLMRVTQRDDILTAGALIEANQVMTAIDANPSLRNDLQSLTNQANADVQKTPIAAVWKKYSTYFREQGYLVLVNPEREIYRVTGKIEYIMEVMEFLMEHEAVSDVEETDIPQTGMLL